jgi:hypothetical protein
VDESHLQNLPSPLGRLYKDFAIIKGKKYGAPRNFDRFTTAWYLNHSDKPNVAIDKHFSILCAAAHPKRRRTHG